MSLDGILLHVRRKLSILQLLVRVDLRWFFRAPAEQIGHRPSITQVGWRVTEQASVRGEGHRPGAPAKAGHGVVVAVGDDRGLRGRENRETCPSDPAVTHVNYATRAPRWRVDVLTADTVAIIRNRARGPWRSKRVDVVEELKYCIVKNTNWY